MRDEVRRGLVAESEPELVSWLASLGFATPEQLWRLLGDGRSLETVGRRLRELRAAGLADRVYVRRGEARESVYFLTWPGAWVAARLLHAPEVLRYLRRIGAETVHLRHHLAVNDLIARLRARLPGVEVVPRYAVRLRWQYGGVWHSVTPDSVVLVPGAALVLEYDRGTRQLPELRRQVQRYAEAARAADLPSWARSGTIVYVLEDPDPRRRDAILEAAAGAGIGDRVAVVPLSELHELEDRLVVRGEQ